MQLDYVVIDAFSKLPFRGNPAGVVLLPADIPDDACQSIAAEFNLAETAFIRPAADGPFGLRWFTPTCEVPLCGHATLASAHALWDWSAVPQDQAIEFKTVYSGTLKCRRAENGMIAMDFPATKPEPASLPANAAEALRVAGPIICVGSTRMNLTLALPDEEQVRSCRPDMGVIAHWHETGVIVTAPSSTPGIDFVSRFFAPKAGVPEDPVTGSAHCALAVYWAERLKENTFVARQLSARGGELHVKLLGDRVELAGNAVAVIAGKLTL